MRSFSFVVLTFLLLSTSCTTLRQWVPFFREETKPHVVIAFQEKSAQVIVLVRDLDLPVSIAPADRMPFTHNSRAMLIVGHAFPYEKLSEVLEWVRHYYRDIHYVKVTDPLDRNTPYTDHARLFIGASTDEAVQSGLIPWSVADLEQLRKVKSQEEMVRLIRFKNGQLDPSSTP